MLMRPYTPRFAVLFALAAIACEAIVHVDRSRIPNNNAEAGGASSSGASAVNGATGGAGFDAGEETCSLNGTAYLKAPTTARSWHGSVWTNAHGDGSSISTASFASNMGSCTYCASGSIGSTKDGSASMGINLQQEPGSPDLGFWSPPFFDETFLVANVTNPGSFTVTVELKGAAPNNDSWCFELAQFNQDAPIAWEALGADCNVESANDSGVSDAGTGAYAGQPLQSVVFVLRSPQSVGSRFDFCINHIGLGTYPE